MDVPSWHPANQDADALRRLAMTGGGPSQRIEFNEVNTLTEEERKMVSKDESAVLGGGRGLLDASDRMYLVEQTLLEQQATKREQMKHQAALQVFRSNALKAHAQKPILSEIPVVTRKKTLSPPEKTRMVVKVKKRKNKIDTKQKQLKKSKMTDPIQTQSSAEVDDTCEKTLENPKREENVSRSQPQSSALLIEDYSSDEGQ